MSGRGMQIAFFGSSLVSAYWNGAATYYRGLLRALADRGHRITFYEPDAFDRQEHRDMEDPEWAQVVVYQPTLLELDRCLEDARRADLVVKASGVGVMDDVLEAAVLNLQNPSTLVTFWDVDAPATLDRLRANPDDAFRPLVSRYDIVFTYGGGPPVVQAYEALGARRCVPIYNAADRRTHKPAARDSRFKAMLGFLGNRLPDRESRVKDFFFDPAAALPGESFVLGGNGWEHDPARPNVKVLGHVYTRDHNAFNATPRAILNINRDSMASYGFSPATRIFEAAAAGACLISDAWQGLDWFLEPGREVLVAEDGDAVVRLLADLTPARAGEIGQRALARILADHTYRHRAEDVERALGYSSARPAQRSKSAGSSNHMQMVFLGLSITSSWGNGHASTYRALVGALSDAGHDVLFLERDTPWYADNRDLPEPPYGRTALYNSVQELRERFAGDIANADFVMVGSYVPDGIEIGHWVTDTARGVASFYDIDTPVTLEALEAGTCEYLSKDLVSRYDLYLSFTGGGTLRRLEELGSPCARALYCSVDPEMYRSRSLRPIWDVGYMGTFSEDRQPQLEELLLEPARALPDSLFAVAGPQYPKSIKWPANVDRVEHLSPVEHSEFYNRMRYTLNLTRADMVRTGYAPSVRLFEAASCAVPIMSDAWPGIECFFEPGTEILLVRSASDVIRALRDISDSDRLTMGRRAQRRVLDQHTSAHRAAELRDHILDAAGCRDRASSAAAQGKEKSAICPPVRTSLARRIEELGPWFHNLELDGIQTAPDHFLGDYPRSKWRHFEHGVPADLGGRSVLDLGCNAGFYSFEMKRRGAGRVVAADCDERYLAQGRLAAEVMGVADVAFRTLSVYDVADLGERFDLVLFMGVLYHLRHPLLALDLLREHVVGDMLLFQSLQRGSSEVESVATDYSFQETGVFEQPGYPHMSFVEHSYAGDPSNWWIPNRACAEAMLRSAGFSVEQQLAGDTYLCRAGALGPLQEMRIRDGLGKRGLHELGASRDGGVA